MEEAKEKAKKILEDTKTKVESKLAKEGEAEAEVKVDKYMWSSGMCMKQELCGTSATAADLKDIYKMDAAAVGEKKYTWECSATSLAASIAATAAIAYTM